MGFKEDCRLILELEAMITAEENHAKAAESDLMNVLACAILPGAGKLMPLAGKQAVKKLDVLTRLKTRLEELLEMEHSRGGDNA